MNIIRSQVSGFLNKVMKSKASIFVPMFDALVPIHRNVLGVLSCDQGKILIPGSNIVTTAGDQYYAQQATRGSTNLSTTGNTTNGSAVITNLGSTTGLAPQQLVECANFALGTRILSIDSGTQITVSNNSSATSTGVAIRFYGLSTNTFDQHELASAGTPGKSATRATFTTIGSTQLSHSSGYPKLNDTDPDNTGAGAYVITYLGSYSKASFSAASITHGLITNRSPGASEPLLTGYAFSGAFAKTTNDSLKVFVNHTTNGV